MPTTPAKNLLYRAALPILAPRSRGQMTHHASGHPLTTLPNYERILAKHHVFGASLLLQDGANCALCNTSTAKPEHLAQENTRYRVASITKMATALVTLRCIDNGLFALDSEAASLLPDGEKAPALSGVTVRHLLCHTSGPADTGRLPERGQAVHGTAASAGDSRLRARSAADLFQLRLWAAGMHSGTADGAVY